MGLYGPGRALTEVYRGDLHECPCLGPVSLSQIICLAIASASILALWIWSRRSGQPAVQPSGRGSRPENPSTASLTVQDQARLPHETDA